MHFASCPFAPKLSVTVHVAPKSAQRWNRDKMALPNHIILIHALHELGVTDTLDEAPI